MCCIFTRNNYILCCLHSTKLNHISTFPFHIYKKMCSVGDDFDSQDTNKYMPTASTFKTLESKCNKCRNQIPKVVLRGKDVYCRECFIAGTVHKFKAFLGKHRLVKPDDKVLIDFRDGHASTALLHFIRSGLDLNTPKKLRFQPIVIYVEDRYNFPLEKRKEILKYAKAQISTSGFAVHYVPLIEYMVRPDKLKDILKANENIELKENDFETLKTVIDKCANKTNKQEILNVHRKSLLIKAAKLLQCKTVFTTEIAVDIASQLLTNVSLGRGIHLPLNIGIADTRDSDVTIMRPLRLFDIKELALYNYHHNLEPLIIKEKLENPYSSVQNLMKSFIGNLQSNYPATITTIVRTGDKLALDSNLIGNELCHLCKAPKETKLEELGSAESTSFSHWLSTRPPNYSHTPLERYDEAVGSFMKHPSSEFCFACDRLSKDLLLNK